MSYWYESELDGFKLHRLLAETDALTGVPNRASSAQGLERMLRMAKRREQPVSLGLLDLDRFKAINDRHGHAAGDAVLRRLGELLLQTFRGEDVVGRWGGEEFDGARSERFAVTFSCGVALYPDDGADAAAALYRAKAAGRASVVGT